MAFENCDDWKDFVLPVNKQCSKCRSRPRGDNLQTVMMSPCWLGIPTIPTHPLFLRVRLALENREDSKDLVLLVSTRCSKYQSCPRGDNVQTVMMSPCWLGISTRPPFFLLPRLALENRDDGKDFVLSVSTQCSQCQSCPSGDNVKTVMMSPCLLGIPTIPTPLPSSEVCFRELGRLDRSTGS